MKLNEAAVGQVVILSNGIKAEVVEHTHHGCFVNVRYIRKNSTGLHGMSGDWECRLAG